MHPRSDGRGGGIPHSVLGGVLTFPQPHVLEFRFLARQNSRTSLEFCFLGAPGPRSHVARPRRKSQQLIISIELPLTPESSPVQQNQQRLPSFSTTMTKPSQPPAGGPSVKRKYDDGADDKPTPSAPSAATASEDDDNDSGDPFLFSIFS